MSWNELLLPSWHPVSVIAYWAPASFWRALPCGGEPSLRGLDWFGFGF